MSVTKINHSRYDINLKLDDIINQEGDYQITIPREIITSLIEDTKLRRFSSIPLLLMCKEEDNDNDAILQVYWTNPGMIQNDR